MKNSMKLWEIEKYFEWPKWREEIPFIPFKESWLVKPIPPSVTGIVRFQVKDKNKPESWVSVYLDCYDIAGCVGKPYWEIYPIGGDCARYMMYEVDSLVCGIQEALDEQP